MKRRTIKKRLFFSNMLMVLSPVGAWIVLTPFMHILVTVLNKTFGVPLPAGRGEQNFGEIPPAFIAVWFIVLILFMIVIFFANRFLTHIMVKHIITPLDTLSNGVRQIRDNNLGFRLAYQGEDEFRPVCDAFNEMAARLEAMIAERQKDEDSRRELIAGISHDLRTPLTSIKAYIEGIETGVASTPEQQKKYFITIKNKSQDLEHIINQLFLFSKLDLNDFPLNLKTLDAGLLIADIITELSDEYAKRGLTIEPCEIAPVFVNLDPVLFRTVIVNILENSVKYTDKESACIKIESAVTDSALELRLTDDGPGVAKEALEKLFDVFYRDDPSRNTKGNGLGLAISKKLINRMGGTIHAELPEVRGLSIVIQLPVVQSMAEKERA